MDLNEITENYQCSTAAVTLVRSSRIVLLAGIAGAGKDTLKNELLKNAQYRDIVSHTTREPRKNNGILEEEGRDYHFIRVSEAVDMINDKAFVEVKCIHGDTIYGTSVNEIQAGMLESKILITDVDIQGIAEYKQISSDVTAIFILPPTYETWRERLMKRYDSTEAFDEEWSKRKASALKELEQALAVPYFHFIVNDDLDRSIQVAHEIAQRPDSFHRKDDEARIAARDILESITNRN